MTVSAVEALRELVACKDLNDHMEELSQRESVNALQLTRLRELTQEYRRRNPIAWANARAALAAAQEWVPVWQPIETAPKDGRAIILGAKCGAWIGHWLPVYQSGYKPDNPWSSLMLNHDHMHEKWQPPTGWMPLPPPPLNLT